MEAYRRSTSRTLETGTQGTQKSSKSEWTRCALKVLVVLLVLNQFETPIAVLSKVRNKYKEADDFLLNPTSTMEHVVWQDAQQGVKQAKATLTNGNNINTTRTKQQQQSQEEFRKVRGSLVEQLFANNPGKNVPLPDNSEEIVGGPILDFVIAGFPKCGTTGMMRTLHEVTTMPSNSDQCMPMKQTIWRGYNNWPMTFGGSTPVAPYEYSAEKPLKGSKCPYWLESENDLEQLGRIMPKTKIIVGIRHPVLYFQSFVNQVNERETNRCLLVGYIVGLSIWKDGPKAVRLKRTL